ncbi:hypothetical protein AB0F92_40495 [Kitasatospora aureofaciens]|uniref:hypothetical protein n=1 Tax=Kitasatospora aureofaciens TaxID=1894 RepID=UPI00092A5C4A|nr:hypothetical protein CP971_05485 [Streptomyces viridifaciens]UKZ04823.1 hypothetical protein BOQ63_012350 [Streptomyces viridifaciens]
MAITVLFEMEPGQIPDPENEASGVLRVHAAATDPDVVEDPLDQTLCGRSTAALVHSHYRPVRPGEPWYPFYLRARRCPECEDVLRRT